VDFETIHEPPRTHDSQTHPGFGSVLAAEDFIHIDDAGAPVGNVDDEDLGRSGPFHEEFRAAAGSILEGVAGDLGDGGREARLLLGVETEQTRDLAGALMSGNHILLVADFGIQNGKHYRSVPASRTTATVTSSRRLE